MTQIEKLKAKLTTALPAEATVIRDILRTFRLIRTPHWTRVHVGHSPRRASIHRWTHDCAS